MAESPLANSPELSVSELSAALKRTVEDRFGLVRVRGEISNFRGQHSSGHAYFVLKDQSARLDAVIWKGVFGRLKHKPQEGLEVVATGKITTYPGKSSYQIVIEALEPAGVGALMALLDERRRKLAAEGLFDPARKQLPPYLPEVVGIVTSPTGAVIRDILHRLADRFPRRVLVWPVRVQGETAAGEVAAAIEGFNALPAGGKIPRPDVLIVARGGGSLEDLWAFNEEIVVRAAAASMIPLVSAIGHETDTTLIDFAADLRAPTPTGAAEKIVPVRADLAVQTAEIALRLERAERRLRERRLTDLRAFARMLPRADDVLAGSRQSLDAQTSALRAAARDALARRAARLARLDALLAKHAPGAELARARARLSRAAERLGDLAGRQAERRRDRLADLDRRLQTALAQRAARARDDLANRRKTLEALRLRLRPAAERHLARQRETLTDLAGRRARAMAARLSREREQIAHRRQAAEAMAARLAPAFARLVARKRDALAGRVQLLDSLDYKKVLARGFAIVWDEGDQPVRAAAALAPGQHLKIEFSDGKRAVAVDGEPPARRSLVKKSPGGQGSLF